MSCKHHISSTGRRTSIGFCKEHKFNILYIFANSLICRCLHSPASEETFLHLIYTKCIPILLYAIEVSPINKADIKSLDFMVNRFLYKLFRTGNPDIIENCRSFFNLKLPCEIIHHRVKRFASKISYIDNILCTIFQ